MKIVIKSRDFLRIIMHSELNASVSRRNLKETIAFDLRNQHVDSQINNITKGARYHIILKMEMKPFPPMIGRG